MRILVPLLAACTSGFDPLVEVDEDHPTVVHVSFETGQEGTSTVTFALADGTGQEHTSPPVTGTTHEHQLLGLKEGREYSWEAELTSSNGGTKRRKGTVTAGSKPEVLPSFDVLTVDDRSQVLGNYLMFAASDGNGTPSGAETSTFFIAILDHEADWVWWHILPPATGTVTGTPSLDGRSIYWTEYDETRESTDATIVRMTLDGEELSRTAAPEAHHATVELQSGQFAYLGHSYERIIDDDRGDWAMTDTLVLTEEGATEPGTILFDYFTDWFDGFEGYPFPPCGRTIQRIGSYRSVCELTHTNSLVFEPTESAFYLYPRSADATLKVNMQGGLVWQMGGPWNDFSLPSGQPVQLDHRGNLLWSQGHFSHVWPGGMVLFDNGLYYEPQRSALAEYRWNETERVVEETWRYPEPDGGFTGALGDVRKLTGGNYLASWMSLAQITEVTPEGEEVYRLESPTGLSPRRLFLLEDLYDLNQTGSGAR